jgi:multiple sugar transport system substrate-binding protein
MRVRAVILAAALMLVPLAAWAADLVVWWDKAPYPEEDRAVRELVAAFEHKTDKHVELTFFPSNEVRAKARAVVEAGQPPDFLFSLWVQGLINEWAYDDQLLDLSDAIEPFRDLFAPDTLDQATVYDRAGKRALYGLPMGRSTLYVHAWKSLLERAGFRLTDIPTEWEPFWSFWCDKVQPAVRKASGRDDIYGVGLPMSVTGDTQDFIRQFQLAYGAEWVSHEGKLLVDNPAVRDRLAAALTAYTVAWRKSCTPPDAVDWDDYGNNKAFLTQRVAMTVNDTLSIPNALKATRSEDYYENVATLDWPGDARGQPLQINGILYRAAAFRRGGHELLTKEFVRFLLGEGWLAHWLDFAGERLLPPLPSLLQQPFWLSPGDPHRMRSALQILTRPSAINLFYAAPGNKAQAFRRLRDEGGWAKAVYQVAADGWSLEHAVDEAIARIKQILSE